MRDRPIGARYVVENLSVKDGEVVELDPFDEVIGSSWTHPLTFITILRFRMDDDDE